MSYIGPGFGFDNPLIADEPKLLIPEPSDRDREIMEQLKVIEDAQRRIRELMALPNRLVTTGPLRMNGCPGCGDMQGNVGYVCPHPEHPGRITCSTGKPVC